MTSRRQQRDNRPNPLDVAALEHELHEKQPAPNRQERRASDRSAAAAEAASIARPAGNRFVGRPTA